MSNDSSGNDEPSELARLRLRVDELERQLRSQRDATEALRVRNQRQQREAATVARIAVSAAVAEGRVEDLAREIGEAAADALELERVGVWLFDDGERSLVCVDTFERGLRRHSAGAVLRQEQYAAEFAALKNSQYVDADDPLHDPRTAGYVEGYLKPNRISAMLDAVIRGSGRNLGVVCFEQVGRAHHWEADEIAFACQLADQVALALSERERYRAERERQALRDQLFQAQKMESVGRLAGGVAHDINNFLGVILGNAELAASVLEPGSPCGVYLQEIRSASQRSAEVVRQLLAFARRQTARPRRLDLNAAVDSTLRMLRRLVREDIEIQWVPANDLWPVRMDPSQLDQIVANLVVNARDALVDAGAGGVIRVETSNQRVEPPAAEAGPAPGEYGCIAVSDNGPGLSREAMEHLFEPFFTTKSPGHGTGLGLSTVYGIVRQNGGQVRVDSQPGRGARFEIFLPRCREVPEPLAVESAPRPGGGAETVLLVEDQEMVRRVATLMLESLGYRVVRADTPQEALRLSEAHQGEIHLVITDVVMPGMNGVELVRALQERRQRLRCLFISGYTENVIARDQVLKPGIRLLEKPFSLDQLDAMVRQVLAEPVFSV